jgi:hypothetical protein
MRTRLTLRAAAARDAAPIGHLLRGLGDPAREDGVREALQTMTGLRRRLPVAAGGADLHVHSYCAG